ncbi:MAG: SMP-30/gluconolactonase/LRE family protein [Geminicoccaceae bacterium]
MRIEVALDARDGVGEGSFWDEREQALWWVDIAGKAVQRWRPETGEHHRWPMPDFPSAVVLRERGGALLAMRDGLYFMDVASGALQLFCAPDAERPDNRSNEAKCGPTGEFWLGTMDNNLHPDGSPREMKNDRGALYRVRPDGSFTREVNGVGLSNTLAWTDAGRTLLFADTLTGIICAFAVNDDGSLGSHRVFSDEKLPGYCDGSTIDADGYLWNARFAGSCLIRFAPDGRVDRILELPVTNPTCCCFGGPDLRTLYVTSARFGLAPEQIARVPAEGAILAVDAGVIGTSSVRFAG